MMNEYMKDKHGHEITIKLDMENDNISMACFIKETSMFMPIVLTITQTTELIKILERKIKDWFYED